MKKEISIGLIFIVAIAPIIFIESSSNMQPFYARPWQDPVDELDPVDIRNIGYDTQDDIFLQGRTTEIIVRADGAFTDVFYSIDNGQPLALSQYLSTDRYFAAFGLNLVLGSHTVRAWTENNGIEVDFDIATFVIVADYVADLYYEIDYMTGLEPSQALLNYWVDYWHDRAINLHYVLDDEVPYEAVVSDLFAYEAIYNDWEFQAEGTTDDRRSIVGSSVFDSQEKWMLFGSSDSNSNTGGYTYVDTANQRGNYIMICCDMISNFESTYGLPHDGALLVVTMHEAGHSIGVLKITTRGRGSEIYNPVDYYDIMSSMHLENCGFENHWYYAYDYWSTRNIAIY
ncbi:MAG: hypothetical protein HGN29_11200 [Asgard group archaeon]|nr:hypothetical protein [Asgard group archaeon]